MSTKMPTGISIAYTVAAFVATVAGLELLFGMAGIGEQEYLQPDSKLGFVGIPNKRVTWRTEGFSHTQLNELGLPDETRRLEKDPSKTRIAIVGDSYVEALQVDRSKNICSALERKNQNFEVLNFGTSAYNVGQMYVRLHDQVLKYHPDVVVMTLRPNAVFGLVPDPKAGSFMAAKPTFYLTPEGQLAESDALQEQWQTSKEGKRMRNMSWLRSHSRIYGVVSLLMQDVHNWLALVKAAPVHAAVQVAARGALQSSAPTKAASQAGTQAGIQAVAPTISKDANQERATTYYWPLLEAILQRAKSDCTQAGARLVLVRIPRTGVSENDFETSMLRTTAEKMDIPFVETDAAFDAAKAQGKKLFYDVHFTPAGHELLADLLTEKLSATGNITLAGSHRNSIH